MFRSSSSSASIASGDFSGAPGKRINIMLMLSRLPCNQNKTINVSGGLGQFTTRLDLLCVSMCLSLDCKSILSRRLVEGDC